MARKYSQIDKSDIQYVKQRNENNPVVANQKDYSANLIVPIRTPESARIKAKVLENHLMEQQRNIRDVKQDIEIAKMEADVAYTPEVSREARIMKEITAKNMETNPLLVNVDDIILGIREDVIPEDPFGENWDPFEYDPMYDDIEGLSRKEKRIRKTAKQKKAEVAELDLINDKFHQLDKETSETIKKLDLYLTLAENKIKPMLEGTARLTPKGISELLGSVSSLLTARTQAVNSFSTRIKSQADIIRNYKKQEKEEKGGDSDLELIARLMPNMDLTNQLVDNAGVPNPYIQNPNGGPMIRKTRAGLRGRDPSQDDLFDQQINKLRNSGQLQDNYYDQNIQYENLTPVDTTGAPKKADVIIIKDYSSGNFHFEAVDSNGMIIRDYPRELLPDAEYLRTRLEWDNENDLAKYPAENVVYRVIDSLY